MIRAVIDTNVLVSALINSNGKPSEIMRQVYSGAIKPVVSRGMLAEYEGVLRRNKFKFSSGEVGLILGYFDKIVFDTSLTDASSINTPEEDAVFVAAARYGEAEYLITGNIKHFSGLKNEKFRIVTPAEFMKLTGK
jgi:putative PIN family toxin of toxin-antitoxin system